MRLARLLSLVTVSPALVAAQEAADSTRDSTRTRLRTVTVTSARSATLVGGASAVVVQTDELRSSPAPLLEQALRESPFVLVRQNSRGQMELSVRGSDSRQAAVMLDGIPLTLGWDHRTDPSIIPVTGTRTITIVRGLGSLLNGPNTIGGVIDIEHGAGVANDAWFGGGMDQTGAVVTTLGGERLLTPSLTVRGGAGFRRRDGFSLPNGTADPTANDGLRTNSAYKNTDAFASMRWNGALGRSLGVTVTGFNAERGVPPEETTASPRLWRYPYDSRYVIALSGGSGVLTTPFGTGTIDASAGLNVGATRIDIYDDRTYTTTSASEIGNEQNVIGRVRASHSLGAGTLRAGFTSSNIFYRESTTSGIADYRQNLWSAGAELEMPVTDRTSLAGGVVFDKSSTPETGGRTPGQAPIDALGWRLGATHTVSSSLRLHGSASQRSRFPALRELYSGAANRFQPNPGLKPETLLGFEAGLTWSTLTDAGGRAVAEVTGFHHDLKDAVVRTTVPNPAPPPGSLFRRVNRDNIGSAGVELLASYSFGPGDRAVSISGDALIQRITIKDQTAGNAERHAENNPEQRGTIELGAPLPWSLRGIVNARYTGRQYCINGDTGNEDTLDARVENDVAVERRFALPGSGLFRSLRALFSVDNVSDAAVFDQCGLVQPGRTLRLMFTLQ